MSHPDQPEPGPPPSIEEFLGEPTRELSRWRWLWTSDAQFPIRTHRAGPLGRLVVFFKRLVRPLVKAPQADLFDRQQAFNLVVLEYLEKIEALEATIEAIRDDLVRDLTEVRTDLLRDVQNNHRRVSHLEGFKRDCFDDVMRHSDALYALVDQKRDRYRRESRDLKSRVSSLLTLIEGWTPAQSEPQELEKRWSEQSYQALEDRFRGTNADIKDRARVYLPYFENGAEVLDLGCGRGETLALLKENGIKARGIDSSSEMVEHCSQRGLEVSNADLISELEGLGASSLDGIVSLHVVEHLPADVVERLVRLAWRALHPG
ncbi:MAG: class I SAM-dependent methyltransferase, partial [Acidobacteriota bacterium]